MGVEAREARKTRGWLVHKGGQTCMASTMEMPKMPGTFPYRWGKKADPLTLEIQPINVIFLSISSIFFIYMGTSTLPN